MNNTVKDSEISTFHYKDKHVLHKIVQSIINELPSDTRNIVVLCIGTDRSTGDSLGPLTGMLFSKLAPKSLRPIGTLHEPVHAINLEDTIHDVNKTFNKPFVIAIDASLGKHTSIGHIIVQKGSLYPGSAFNKDLPSVGDISITGVVNMSGFMDFSVLQSTRLSLVHDMAYLLAQSLYCVDVWLYKNKKGAPYNRFLN